MVIIYKYMNKTSHLKIYIYESIVLSSVSIFKWMTYQYKDQTNCTQCHTCCHYHCCTSHFWYIIDGPTASYCSVSFDIAPHVQQKQSFYNVTNNKIMINNSTNTIVIGSLLSSKRNPPHPSKTVYGSPLIKSYLRKQTQSPWYKSMTLK